MPRKPIRKEQKAFPVRMIISPYVGGYGHLSGVVVCSVMIPDMSEGDGSYMMLPHDRITTTVCNIIRNAKKRVPDWVAFYGFGDCLDSRLVRTLRSQMSMKLFVQVVGDRCLSHNDEYERFPGWDHVSLYPTKELAHNPERIMTERFDSVVLPLGMSQDAFLKFDEWLTKDRGFTGERYLLRPQTPVSDYAWKVCLETSANWRLTMSVHTGNPMMHGEAIDFYDMSAPLHSDTLEQFTSPIEIR